MHVPLKEKKLIIFFIFLSKLFWVEIFSKRFINFSNKLYKDLFLFPLVLQDLRSSLVVKILQIFQDFIQIFTHNR